jgi:transposase
MVPTLCSTPGVEGHRPTVGTRGCKDLLYVLAVVNVATGVLHANTLESPARAKQRTGKSKTRRMQEAFASHLRHIARPYPAERHERAVLIIDDAPWHRGGPIDDALGDHPHLESCRLPRYRPQLNAIERFWKLLRRRATHNRLFDTLADLRWSVRAGLCYFQTVRARVGSLIAGRYDRVRDQSATTGP